MEDGQTGAPGVNVPSRVLMDPGQGQGHVQTRRHRIVATIVMGRTWKLSSVRTRIVQVTNFQEYRKIEMLMEKFRAMGLMEFFS